MSGSDRSHRIDRDGFIWCSITGERRQSGDIVDGDCPACGEEVEA